MVFEKVEINGKKYFREAVGWKPDIQLSHTSVTEISESEEVENLWESWRKRAER